MVLPVAVDAAVRENQRTINELSKNCVGIIVNTLALLSLISSRLDSLCFEAKVASLTLKLSTIFMLQGFVGIISSRGDLLH